MLINIRNTVNSVYEKIRILFFARYLVILIVI